MILLVHQLQIQNQQSLLATRVVLYAVLIPRVGPGGIGFAPLAVVHRFDYRGACGALAEFEVVSERGGGHGFLGEAGK